MKILAKAPWTGNRWPVVEHAPMHNGWEHELAVARSAAAEAGAVALGLQVGVAHHDKADGSPVSVADHAADAVIRHHLTQHFPADGILSEEADDDVSGGRTWVIDPIDGTSGYIAGTADWCVQIALAVDEVPVVGVVDLPGWGVRISGVVGVGAWIEDHTGSRPLGAPCARLDHLVTSASGRNRELADAVSAALPGFTRSGVHSVGVKILHLLSGLADLYVHARPLSAWDAGGPAAVLLAAGGSATDLLGAPLRLRGRVQPCPGFVGSVRTDHAQLVNRMPTFGLNP